MSIPGGFLHAGVECKKRYILLAPVEQLARIAKIYIRQGDDCRGIYGAFYHSFTKKSLIIHIKNDKMYQSDVQQIRG